MTVNSYGMREISPPGPGDIMYSSDPYSAGAAGIGVARARSMRTDNHQPDYSSALKEGNNPYPAFAAPNPGHMPSGGDPYATTTMVGRNSPAHRGSVSAVPMAYSQHPYAHQQYGNSGPYPKEAWTGTEAWMALANANGYGPSHTPGPAAPTNRYSVVNEETEDAYGGVADGVDDRAHDPFT
jgi:hypothetical protein